jgi:nitrite reductase/ring-hydroxylating ferredoxin subunit
MDVIASRFVYKTFLRNRVVTERKIGTLQKLQSRRIQCITVDDSQFVLIYYHQTFYALENTCPHKFASLCTGHLRGDQIVCPWHGAEFDIATGKSFSPFALKGVKTRRVSIRNQSVFIEL